MGDTGILCEICKQKYSYRHESTSECGSSQLIRNRIRINKVFSVALLLFLLLDIGLLCIASWLAITDPKQPNFSATAPRFFLVYISLAICIGSLIFGIYQFVKFFMLETKLDIYPIDRVK